MFLVGHTFSYSFLLFSACSFFGQKLFAVIYDESRFQFHLRIFGELCKYIQLLNHIWRARIWWIISELSLCDTLTYHSLYIFEFRRSALSNIAPVEDRCCTHGPKTVRWHPFASISIASTVLDKNCFCPVAWHYVSKTSIGYPIVWISSFSRNAAWWKQGNGKQELICAAWGIILSHIRLIYHIVTIRENGISISELREIQGIILRQTINMKHASEVFMTLLVRFVCLAFKVYIFRNGDKVRVVAHKALWIQLF